MSLVAISEMLQQQRQFFSTGTTKGIAFRVTQLKTLNRAIEEQKQVILQGLKADLHKPEFEAYSTEIFVKREINQALKNLRSWTKPKKAGITIEQFPATAHLYPEPLGVVLIISAWNYPFQLMISPLIGALAAGNCAILKPSEIAPHTSVVLAEIIAKYFPPNYIAVIEGGVDTTQQLLAQKFDHIFFTGGTAVGKIVMTAAAQHLTPVTLELGGKTPCIIDANVDIEHTARRIAWGKFLNAGQTC
ncbi:MAG: aldehyde dehydrogenase family protein, partial [Nostocaceae cyanobacterium]|nr:aldehyde dehydrogenase family protein [Nostocaceae cyanobacterium]